MTPPKILVIGSGNAALCAAIAALEKGSDVTILEKANEELSGGNSRYTAGAMRFCYNSSDDLIPLLSDPKDERISRTEFGTYSKAKFESDLITFNGGNPLSMHQKIMINHSYDTLHWLGMHHVKFEPIYSRQTFQKDGKYIFWGGLTLEARGEGVGLVEAELAEFMRMGGKIIYEAEVTELIVVNRRVEGVIAMTAVGIKEFFADAVILACGGFEANGELRKKYLGEKWINSKVRGTPHNTGQGIEMALKIGAQFYGVRDGCHATPMDINMPDYGNLSIPHIDRKHYRKICYFLGIMLNARGERFVDEGINFRNYTYAQFGRALLNQPGGIGWQIFDQKVDHLLYDEYKFWDVTCIQADTLINLVAKLDGIDINTALKTIEEYNEAVDSKSRFDPTILDGKGTKGLALNKSNWANILDTPPYKAYPVTCGITFTYGGLKVDEEAAVLDTDDNRIKGLYACGELVGGVFYHGYPGGSGLTSGAVFGRIAGYSAASHKE